MPPKTSTKTTAATLIVEGGEDSGATRAANIDLPPAPKPAIPIKLMDLVAEGLSAPKGGAAKSTAAAETAWQEFLATTRANQKRLDPATVIIMATSLRSTLANQFKISTSRLPLDALEGIAQKASAPASASAP